MNTNEHEDFFCLLQAFRNVRLCVLLKCPLVHFRCMFGMRMSKITLFTIQEIRQQDKQKLLCEFLKESGRLAGWIGMDRDEL